MTRVLLKISGEALQGDREFGIDSKAVKKVVSVIKEIHNDNIQLVIVIGGGNIYRGSDLIKQGLHPSDSHNLSMLSTAFNGVALGGFLENAGIQTKVVSPLGINFIAKYNKDQVKKQLDSGKIVLCVGGTGNPYFTTDTGGVLRALETDCDLLVKATKVDGIYDKDPMKHKNAKMIKEITYDKMISEGIGIMDHTSIIMAKENGLTIKVVNFSKKGAILKAICGGSEGSSVK